jgi:hypothetical protein
LGQRDIVFWFHGLSYGKSKASCFAGGFTIGEIFI